jgi:hypothetical protein
VLCSAATDSSKGVGIGSELHVSLVLSSEMQLLGCCRAGQQCRLHDEQEHSPSALHMQEYVLCH